MKPDEMKCDELRAELKARNLPTDGLKKELIKRLKNALEAELLGAEEKEIPDIQETEKINDAAVSTEAKADAASQEPLKSEDRKISPVKRSREDTQKDDATDGMSVDRNDAEISSEDRNQSMASPEEQKNKKVKTGTNDQHFDADIDLTSSETLLIKNLKRPFAVSSLKELLTEFGAIKDFWIDSIKTHCFVTYNEVSSAQNAMKSLHGKQWPQSTGKYLAVEGISYEASREMIKTEEKKSGRPVSNAAGRAGNAGPMMGGFKSIFSRATKEAVRSTLTSNPVVNGSMASSTENISADNITTSESGQTKVAANASNADGSSAKLDVLFRKTLATPHIYYLPLTEKQVQQKIAASKESTTS
ncbi:hypothetical protein MP638_003939 [Amoeboaphelidium occidentale]|nr:hypothetical protein MP638_003939 [Amoeboaphelidium occidentale]